MILFDLEISISLSTRHPVMIKFQEINNIVKLKADFTYIADFCNARRTVNDVGDFDAFWSDAVYNQMRIKDDVAVDAAFCGDVATFGVREITCGK